MKKLLYACTAALVLSIGYNAYCHYRMNQMQTVVGLMDQKDRLNQEQVRDVMMKMMADIREGQIEQAHAQGKVEGMLCVITNQKPSEYEGNQIWHAGYYRGLDQAKDTVALDRELKATELARQKNNDKKTPDPDTMKTGGK